MRLDRRSALGLMGSGAVLPIGAVHAATPARAAFRHGVASGDPTASGAILWTRVTPADPAHGTPIPVTWHVATQPEGKPVESGEGEARPGRDFTLKVEPRTLAPGRDHWFWFELADGTRSPVGRFRTLPMGKADDLVLAVASCQLYPGGFFNAWDSLAKRDRLDAVIHLGDYIYEYGAESYGATTASVMRSTRATPRCRPPMPVPPSSACGTIMRRPTMPGSTGRKTIRPRAKAGGRCARQPRCRPISNGCQSAILGPASRGTRSTAASLSAILRPC